MTTIQNSRFYGEFANPSLHNDVIDISNDCSLDLTLYNPISVLKIKMEPEFSYMSSYDQVSDRNSNYSMNQQLPDYPEGNYCTQKQIPENDSFCDTNSNFEERQTAQELNYNEEININSYNQLAVCDEFSEISSKLSKEHYKPQSPNYLKPEKTTEYLSRYKTNEGVIGQQTGQDSSNPNYLNGLDQITFSGYDTNTDPYKNSLAQQNKGISQYQTMTKILGQNQLSHNNMNCKHGVLPHSNSPDQNVRQAFPNYQTDCQMPIQVPEHDIVSEINSNSAEEQLTQDLSYQLPLDDQDPKKMRDWDIAPLRNNESSNLGQQVFECQTQMNEKITNQNQQQIIHPVPNHTLSLGAVISQVRIFLCPL